MRRIAVDYELYNFILGCALYDIDSQLATNLHMFVDNQLSSYGLSLSSKILVVADNENKMLAAFEDKWCPYWMLNSLSQQTVRTHVVTSEENDKKLVERDKVQSLFENIKQIVTYVRRNHRQVKLKQKLQLYSDIRFNGAFHMMNAFLNVYDDIGGVVNNNYIDSLTAINNELLEEICGFLKLFDQAVEELSEEE